MKTIAQRKKALSPRGQLQAATEALMEHLEDHGDNPNPLLAGRTRTFQSAYNRIHREGLKLPENGQLGRSTIDALRKETSRDIEQPRLQIAPKGPETSPGLDEPGAS